MSYPISWCLVFRACRSERAYVELLTMMRYNKRCGHWLITPCECRWPCKKPTQDQLSRLDARLRCDIDGICDSKNLELCSGGLSLRFEPDGPQRSWLDNLSEMCAAVFQRPRRLRPKAGNVLLARR